MGSQTYGNPVVADGKVYVGTNNSAGYLKRYPGDVDLGCLLCFDEADGKFLWQHTSEKLITGRVHDWPLQGICCAPLVEGDRLWFVTSRGEVRCLDTDGFHDGTDDGKVTNDKGRVADLANASPDYAPAVEGLNKGEVTKALADLLAQFGEPIEGEATVETIAEGKKWLIKAKVDGVERQMEAMVAGPRLSVFKIITPDDKEEADVLWVYNMMENLDTSQHNMCSCSVTSYGDLLFVNTSNGVDESHIVLPSPDAPSFICMNKKTADVYWSDKSPGVNIVHGQWSSPTVAELGGVPQVIFAGGDGWVYSFKADTGTDGSPELLWKFDANPKTSEWILGGAGTRNNIIATPVVYDGLVYVAVGQDPEHGEGEGHLWCIDPTKRGDTSPQLAMKVEGDKRVPIPHRRLIAVEEEKGEVAIDNPNSAVVWHYTTFDQNGDGEIDFEEEMHRSCGTVAIKDNVLYIADFSGMLHCLDAKGSKDGQPIVHFTYDMLAQAWGSPLIADGHVYIGDEDGDVSIFELGAENDEPIEEINMGTSVYSTPIVANGTIYISTKDKLFAIAPKK
ncbi:MAG: PQQ-binding-like beta-propeller repeat protein [Pirellulaceae bacterium]